MVLTRAPRSFATLRMPRRWISC